MELGSLIKTHHVNKLRLIEKRGGWRNPSRLKNKENKVMSLAIIKGELAAKTFINTQKLAQELGLW